MAFLRRLDSITTAAGGFNSANELKDHDILEHRYKSILRFWSAAFLHPSWIARVITKLGFDYQKLFNEKSGTTSSSLTRSGSSVGGAAGIDNNDDKAKENSAINSNVSVPEPTDDYSKGYKKGKVADDGKGKKSSSGKTGPLTAFFKPVSKSAIKK